ncbi:hypothetical protein MCERE1_00268 [Burkholderiaceae bacterium]
MNSYALQQKKSLLASMRQISVLGYVKNASLCLDRVSVAQPERWLPTQARMVFFSWRAAQKVTRVLTFQMHRLHRRN